MYKKQPKAKDLVQSFVRRVMTALPNWLGTDGASLGAPVFDPCISLFVRKIDAKYTI
jgi:hypothetical protein